MGTRFTIAAGGVITLFIATPQNGPSAWARVIDKVLGRGVGGGRHGRPACSVRVPVTAAVPEQVYDSRRRPLRRGLP
jgi:hypothetical protein